MNRATSLTDTLRATPLWAALRDWRYLRKQRARVRFYASFMNARSLVFDIGANVGHYSLIFEHLGARVVAIEPQAALSERLKKRFARRPLITVEHCALGAAVGSALLRKTAGLSEVASLRADVAERSRFAATHPFDEVETVPVNTLDELIARHGRPDFCKIDVEGFEDAVLSGLSLPIAALSFEFNREFSDVAQRCVERLCTLGPYRFNFMLGEDVVFETANYVGAAELIARLSANRDPLLWGDVYARLEPAK